MKLNNQKYPVKDIPDQLIDVYKTLRVYYDPRGYGYVQYGGKKYKIHRIVYQEAYGDLKPTDIIDHIDGNPKNNKIENLRRTSVRGNSQNRKEHRNGKQVGGTYDKNFNLWHVSIQINGKSYYCGSYKTKESAENAYFQAVLNWESGGEYPVPPGKRLNFNHSVSFIKTRNRWRARITINYKEYHIGFYKTEAEALVAKSRVLYNWLEYGILP